MGDQREQLNRLIERLARLESLFISMEKIMHQLNFSGAVRVEHIKRNNVVSETIITNTVGEFHTVQDTKLVTFQGAGGTVASPTFTENTVFPTADLETTPTPYTGALYILNMFQTYSLIEADEGKRDVFTKFVKVFVDAVLICTSAEFGVPELGPLFAEMFNEYWNRINVVHNGKIMTKSRNDEISRFKSKVSKIATTLAGLASVTAHSVTKTTLTNMVSDIPQWLQIGGHAIAATGTSAALQQTPWGPRMFNYENGVALITDIPDYVNPFVAVNSSLTKKVVVTYMYFGDDVLYIEHYNSPYTSKSTRETFLNAVNKTPAQMGTYLGEETDKKNIVFDHVFRAGVIDITPGLAREKYMIALKYSIKTGSMPFFMSLADFVNFFVPLGPETGGIPANGSPPNPQIVTLIPHLWNPNSLTDKIEPLSEPAFIDSMQSEYVARNIPSRGA